MSRSLQAVTEVEYMVIVKAVPDDCKVFDTISVVSASGGFSGFAIFYYVFVAERT